MISRKNVTGVLAALAMTCAAGSANAQAVAEELFQQGQKLMAEGKVGEACQKFAESQKAGPSTGTLLNLAVCHEKEKKTASAWAEFTEAAKFARRENRTDRENFAKSRAEAIYPQLRRVSLDMKDAPSGAEARVDGQAFSINAELPVDPGEREFMVQAPKKKPWTVKVTVPDGAGVTHIDVPALEAAPIEQAAAPPPPPAAGGQNLVLLAANEDAIATARKRRTLGYIIGGVGVAGVITSGIFFVQAYLQDKQSQDEESEAKRMQLTGGFPAAKIQEFFDASGRDHDAAVRSQTVAFIAGGVGVVGLGVGTYLLLTTKEPAPMPATVGKIQNLRVTPMLGPGTQGASASFTF